MEDRRGCREISKPATALLGPLLEYISVYIELPGIPNLQIPDMGAMGKKKYAR